MIRLLGEEDRLWLEEIAAPEWGILQIQSLLRAYGMGYDFLRFYGDRESVTAMSVLDGNAALCFGEGVPLDELAALLPYVAHTVTAEHPLPLDGWQASRGREYLLPSPPARLESADTSLEQAYQVLSQVFDNIHPGTYAQWYADLSHRIRHNVSQVYTLNGVCTAVAYGEWSGWLGITQLATLPAFRGQGLARRLLAHISAVHRPARGLLLQSRNSHTDRFYQHLGFLPSAEWYCYRQG